MSYFGYSKADWEKLSTQEQSEVKENYQQVLDAKVSQQHKDMLNERTESVIDRGLKGPFTKP